MAGRSSRRLRGIVLGRTKLGEADLILTLLAQDGSQVRAVAKGARKPGGRLAARCELFCEGDYLVAHGRNLGIVSQAEHIFTPSATRNDSMPSFPPQAGQLLFLNRPTIILRPPPKRSFFPLSAADHFLGVSRGRPKSCTA